MTDNLKTCPVCKTKVSYLEPIYDARGIYCTATCGDPACVKAAEAKYRPEIFTDSNYECDEQIEENY